MVRRSCRKWHKSGPSQHRLQTRLVFFIMHVLQQKCIHVKCLGMSSAGKEEWEKLWDIFTKEIDANEKTKLMNGLASVRESWLLKR